MPGIAGSKHLAHQGSGHLGQRHPVQPEQRALRCADFHLGHLATPTLTLLPLHLLLLPFLLPLHHSIAPLLRRYLLVARSEVSEATAALPDTYTIFSLDLCSSFWFTLVLLIFSSFCFIAKQGLWWYAYSSGTQSFMLFHCAFEVDICKFMLRVKRFCCLGLRCAFCAMCVQLANPASLHPRS